MASAKSAAQLEAYSVALQQDGHKVVGWRRGRGFHTHCMRCGKVAAVNVTKGIIREWPESCTGEERNPPMTERIVKKIRCCNRELECPDFTNTCPVCHADYNWAGQRLAPRDQWGEETGETYADIVRPYAPGEEWGD